MFFISIAVAVFICAVVIITIIDAAFVYILLS